MSTTGRVSPREHPEPHWIFGVIAPSLAGLAVVLHFVAGYPPGVTGALAGGAVVAVLAAVITLARSSGKSGFERDLATAFFRDDDMVLITDQTGAPLASTSAFQRHFGARSGLVGLKRATRDPGIIADLDVLLGSAQSSGFARADIALGADTDRRYWRIRVMGGHDARLVWSLEDVSKDKRALKSARQQTRIMVDFFDNLPVGFYALDDKGCFEYANARFAGWVGKTQDDLSESDIPFDSLVVGGGALPEDGVGYVRLKGGGGDTFQAYVIRNCRESDTVEGTRAVVLRDPGADTGAEHPVTGELAIESPPALPEWLFCDAPIGIAILDDHGSVRSCNAALGRFLERSVEDLKGAAFVSFIAPEDHDDYSAVLSKMMMGTANAAHVEARFSSGDGAAERAASLFVNRIGQDGGMVLHVIDETEHRHLELQFTQSQKMQAVGQLAGGVAHDFNNLLTAMIGFSDLLLERLGPDDASFNDIMQIKQNANRATNLVRQLLAFSRKQTLEPVVLDPTEMLGDLSHLLGRLIGERVALKFEHAPDAYLIRADRGQFDQVIINLAVNARDAMPGGGTLTVRTRNESVTVPVQRGPDVMPPGAYVVISVSDTGTGISRENLDRIFEPFFSTKEVGAGTGLGLSTVYGIIRQSEGFIYVESALGHGTTFHIYLPASGAEGEKEVQAAARAADRARLAHRSAEEYGADGKNGPQDLSGAGVILLVEDEDAVRLFGARALRNKGYTVLEADNGESALDVLNATRQPIDLIVSDVVMPGMDGHTFVQLVRQEMPDIRLILMSGYTEEVFREEISRDPSIHFLAKPFSLKTLAGTVRDVMDGT